MAGQIYRALQRNPDPLGGLSSLAQMYLSHLDQEQRKKAVFDRLSQTNVTPVMGNPATVPVANPPAAAPATSPAPTMQHPVDAQGLVGMLPKESATTELPRFQGTETTTRLRQPSELSTQERFGLGSDLGMNAGQILDFLAKPAPQTHFAPAGSQPGYFDATGKFVPSGDRIPREFQPRAPQRPLAPQKPESVFLRSEPVTKNGVTKIYDLYGHKDASNKEVVTERKPQDFTEKSPSSQGSGGAADHRATEAQITKLTSTNQELGRQITSIQNGVSSIPEVKGEKPEDRATRQKAYVDKLRSTIDENETHIERLNKQIGGTWRKGDSEQGQAASDKPKMKLSDIKSKWGAEAVQGYSDDELRDYLKKQNVEVE
jgi:hypothetical protein